MVTNTERIQANNAELREAIEMAETLPDGGGLETCEVNVLVAGFAEICYTDEKALFDLYGVEYE